jgi:Domain of unknown function (DUF4345)
MAARIFLGLTALIWLPYGLYAFAQPGFLAEAAGVVSTTPTGVTDLRASYGGLTAALGALALLGALSPAWTRQALVTLGTACAGFGVARLAGTALDGGVGAYTVQALLLEFGTLAFALWLLRRPAATA